MATFRCKQSGNTLSFSDEGDIASMRKESHYEEIGNEGIAIQAYSETNDSASQDGDWQSGADTRDFYAEAQPGTSQSDSTKDAETKEDVGVLSSELAVKKRGRPAKVQFEAPQFEV